MMPIKIDCDLAVWSQILWWTVICRINPRILNSNFNATKMTFLNLDLMPHNWLCSIAIARELGNNSTIVRPFKFLVSTCPIETATTVSNTTNINNTMTNYETNKILYIRVGILLHCLASCFPIAEWVQTKCSEH